MTGPVAEHYTSADLEERILAALAAQGLDVDRLSTDDLARVDEFHVEGRAATVRVLEQLDLRPGMRVLDVGSGLGGPSRYAAKTYDVAVTGIDLTQVYVDVATSLSRRTDLADRTTFRQGSATDLPFADASFERAYLVHVGMNIEDKPRLFAEVRRVLTDDAVFVVYDVLATGTAEVGYPVPWAASPDISFPATLAQYRTWLTGAGFEIVGETDHSEGSAAFFRAQQDQPAAPGPGLALALGADAAAKLRGMAENLARGAIAPTELICRTAATP